MRRWIPRVDDDCICFVLFYANNESYRFTVLFHVSHSETSNKLRRRIQYASEGSWDSRQGPFGLAIDHTAKRSKEKIILRRAKQS